MSYRWKSLEYIRFIAIILIVCCHFLPYYFGSGSLLLGGFGNAAFFALSAILLGNEWASQNKPSYGAKFLAHRIGKIVPSYYLFITGWFIFLFFAENYFSLRTLALYYAFLPWLDKLNGVGHLWFITMIVFCYFTLAIVSQLNFLSKNFIYRNRKWLLIAALPLSLLAQYFMQQKNLPSYSVAILTATPLIFLHAEWFFSNSVHKKLLFCGLFFAVILTGLCYLCGNGALQFLVFDFAMLSMIFFIKLFISFESHIRHVPKIISFVAGISFEIYLIHHVFCMGKYAIYRHYPNAFLQSAIFLVITLTGAVLLHWLSGRITGFCRKKK